MIPPWCAVVRNTLHWFMRPLGMASLVIFSRSSQSTVNAAAAKMHCQVAIRTAVACRCVMTNTPSRRGGWDRSLRQSEDPDGELSETRRLQLRQQRCADHGFLTVVGADGLEPPTFAL